MKRENSMRMAGTCDICRATVFQALQELVCFFLKDRTVWTLISIGFNVICICIEMPVDFEGASTARPVGPSSPPGLSRSGKTLPIALYLFLQDPDSFTISVVTSPLKRLQMTQVLNDGATN